MTSLHHLALLPLAALLLACQPALGAGDDHGHDHGGTTPAAAVSAQPRFAAVSDLFELVGVLDGKQLTLYLDRAADNSPVTNARIDLEIAGQTFQASRQGSDAFAVLLPAAPKPGVLPITATVSAGDDSDLLAGELDIHGAADAAHAAEPGHARRWTAVAGWAAGGLAALAVLVAVLALVGRRLAARRGRPGAAA